MDMFQQLLSWVAERLEAGASAEDILSALELQVMAMREELDDA